VRTWGSNNKWGNPASLSGCSEGLTNGAQVSENLGGNPAVDRPAQQFGEAAINLTCAGITPSGSCEGFSSAYVKSRSSTSFTSEIKDFIAPVAVSFSNCGAIVVSKTHKHAADGAGDHPESGVNFTIGSTTIATDANGQACFPGLALGQSYTVTETVPAGEVSDDSSQDVAVNSVGSCTSGAATVSFHNTPLTNVEIKIHSQVDGCTQSSVDCDNDALDAAAAGDVDVTASDQQPQTIHCTIVVDP